MTKSRKASTPTLRACSHCGNEFLGKTRAKYCSKLCKNQANYQTSAVKSKIDSRITATRSCLLCGNEFKPIRNSHRYCKSTCASHAATKRHRANHPEHHRIKSQEARKANPERHRSYSRKHAQKHRAKITDSVRNRRHNDPSFKIASNLRGRINSALKAQGAIKSSSLWEVLGCDKQTLILHLESQFTEGMTWQNHTTDGWHIDHRKPCAAFDLTNVEEQKLCFHYTNLQPLWSKENQSKNSKWEAIDLL